MHSVRPRRSPLSVPLLAGLALLIAPLEAQSGPGQITGIIMDPVFRSNNLATLGIYDTNGTGRGTIQINMTKSSPADTPGKWTAALTIADLAPAYGGAAGKQYVLMGQYDTTGSTPTFKPDHRADKMNNTSKADCFGLMIEGRDGLFASVDWNDGAYLGWRIDNTSAFQTPVKIGAASGATPLPGTYIDPSLGYVDNKLKLFFTDKVNSIFMQDITPTIQNNVLVRAVMEGKPVAVATLGIRPHSPTPIIDQGGEVRGLWMAANSGNDSDMYFVGGLSTNDKPIKVYDNTGWMNNGGVAGGTLFFVSNDNYNIARNGQVAWLLGSNTSLGSIATMTLGCRDPKNSSSVLSRIALSIKANAGTQTPVSIPGWNGSYALADPILVFTSMSSTDADELAHWSTSVPNQPALKGQRISIQGLCIPQGVNPTLTNTATLEFK